MDPKQVWRATLGELQVSLSPANYETWLKDTALISVDDTRFRVAVPNGFAKDWLETRYRSLISQTLARVVGYSVNVEFEVRDIPPADAPAAGDRERAGNHSPVLGVVDASGNVSPRSSQGDRVRLEPGRVGGPEGSSVSLNPRYTFRRSSSDRPTGWHTPPHCPWRNDRVTPITRSSCTAESVSARRT